MKRIRRTQKTKDTTAITQQIWDIEERWMNERMLGVSLISDRLLADDYFGIDSRGHLVTKDEFLHLGAADKVVQGNTYTKTHRVMFVGGQMAISMGRLVLSFAAGGDKVYRYVRIFEQRSGDWLLVASQSTLVEPDEERA